MTTPYVSHEQTRYRLLLVSPQQRLAFVDVTSADAKLPTIDIPPFTRPAEQVTAAIRERWSLNTAVIDWIKDVGNPESCAVVELRPASSRPYLLEGLTAHTLDELPGGVISAALLSTVREMLAGDARDRGIFSRFGWLDEVQDWIRSAVGNPSLEFTSFRQFNASGSFALVRLESNQRIAYWLKAVGGSNTREFSATAYLSQSNPIYLPRIIGMKGDWMAWIMEEFGNSLHHSGSLPDFQRAVVKLANLQKALIGSTSELLAAGCVDHRTTKLDQQVDQLICYLDEAMQKQTSTAVRPLDSQRLREMRTTLHQACASLQELGIPDSIMHCDISPGSILSDGSDCVFTDWCEAYVGNPFITFEQFCIHIGRAAVKPALWIDNVTDLYIRSWKDVVGTDKIEKALRLVPLISVLSYLLGSGDWLQTDRRMERAVMSYSRSLARRMDRLAADLKLREVL